MKSPSKLQWDFRENKPKICVDPQEAPNSQTKIEKEQD
jgi:hypothetical protein